MGVGCGEALVQGAANHLHVGSLHVKLGKLQLRAHRTGERRGASQGQPAGLETKRAQGERQHLVAAALEVSLRVFRLMNPITGLNYGTGLNCKKNF